MDAAESRLPTNATGTDHGAADAPPVSEATRLLRELIEVSDLFEARLREHLSVNPTDLEAMSQLLGSGPLGPTELARRLHISTASTTVVVDRLEALGHVTRVRHPVDRRGVLVVPTPSSRERAMGMLAPMITDVDSVLDDFAPEDREMITDYLSRVVGVYRAHVNAASPDALA